MLTRFDRHGLRLDEIESIQVSCQTEISYIPDSEPTSTTMVKPVFSWTSGPSKITTLLQKHWRFLVFLTILTCVSLLVSLTNISFINISKYLAPKETFNYSDFSMVDAITYLDTETANGEWGSWNVFVNCHQNCSTVYQLESRECNNPLPKGYGHYCIGKSMRSTPCGDTDCSWTVDGSWGNWVELYPCLDDCKDHVRLDVRECNNPTPQGKGKSCNGDFVKSSVCGVRRCLQASTDKCYPCLNYVFGLCNCAGIVNPVKDCKHALTLGFNMSGVYQLDMQNYPRVFCDQETNGGGWLIFQQRRDETENFRRDWDAYKKGFGNFSSGYWLGNQILHELTNSDPTELLVYGSGQYGRTAWSRYDSFKVGNEATQYQLVLSGWTTSPGVYKDPMDYQNYKKFTTNDDCSYLYQGGWWFNSDFPCARISLNGKYYDRQKDNVYVVKFGVYWGQSHFNDSLKFVEMKLRRKN